MMKLKELKRMIPDYQTISLLDSYTGKEIKCSDMDTMNMLVTEVVATSQDHIDITLYNPTPGIKLIDVLLLIPDNTMVDLFVSHTRLSTRTFKYKIMSDTEYDKYLTTPVVKLEPMYTDAVPKILHIACDGSSIDSEER